MDMVRPALVYLSVVIATFLQTPNHTFGNSHCEGVVGGNNSASNSNCPKLKDELISTNPDHIKFYLYPFMDLKLDNDPE